MVVCIFVSREYEISSEKLFCKSRRIESSLPSGRRKKVDIGGGWYIYESFESLREGYIGSLTRN